LDLAVETHLKKTVFIGVDISQSRGCAWTALDKTYRVVGKGWVNPATDDEVCSKFLDAFRQLSDVYDIAGVGIDSPQKPLEKLREKTWRRGRWETLPKGRIGRHAEIVVRALKLANPQWTPERENAPPWMRLGFALFECIGDEYPVHEIFPSASYTQLSDQSWPVVSCDFSGFQNGPKDVLDAIIGAVTIGEFSAGRGSEVGDRDGLGTIVLPRATPTCPPELLEGW
jgi:predicted nuclease with RNAse H fold